MKPGGKAPLFTATDLHDEPYALADALKNGPVVLIFYRGQWCPICNMHLKALQEKLPEIYRRGAMVVAVSPEKSEFLKRTAEKTGAEFTLLFDEGYKIADAFDVTFQPGKLLRGVYNNVLRVFERLLRQVGLRLRQRFRKIGDGLALPLVQVGLHLNRQDTPRPVVLQGAFQVKFSLYHVL